jgi:Ser/Thr protein kinase RdoA (MazF antagonist)
VNNELTAQSELLDVLNNFPFDGEAEISFLYGGTANKNYLVKSADGRFPKYVLRCRNERYCSEVWVEYEEEALTYLAANGLPVPVPLRWSSGKLHHRAGRHIYQLFPYMPGDAYQHQSLAMLAGAGDFLGKFHSISARFRTNVNKTLPRYDDPGFMLTVMETSFPSDHPIWMTPERRIVERVRATVELLAERFPDTLYFSLPQAMIHGDFHPGNVAFRGNRICALYDFDWISSQPRIRDVADGLLYFAARRDRPAESGDIFSLTEVGEFDGDCFFVFLDAYQKQADDPLSAEELIQLPDQMCARFICSRLQAFRKIDSAQYGEMATRGVERPLDWFDRNGSAFAAEALQRYGYR